MLRQKPTQVLPLKLLKEAAIHFYCLFDELRFSHICAVMELMVLGLVGCRLGLGGVGGSRPCISMNLLVGSAGHGFFGVGVIGGHGFVIFLFLFGIFLLQVATKIGNHHRISCGDNFTSKNFKKLSLVESYFNIR